MSPYVIYVLLLSVVLLLWQGLRGDLDDTLRRIGRHWILFAIFFLLCFAASGSVIKGLGLPHLFRDDPELKGWGQVMNSSVFWTQFGISVLLCTIWTYIYRLEVLERAPFAGDDGRRWTIRRVVLTYGLPMTLYVVGAAALPVDGRWPSYSDAFKGILGVVFAVLAFLIAVHLTQRLLREVHRRAGLARYRWIVGLLDLIQFLMVGPSVSPRNAPLGHETNPMKRIRELRSQLKQVNQPEYRLAAETVDRRSEVARALGFVILALISILLVSAWDVLQAGVSIVLLMGWILLAFFVLGFFKPFAKFWIVLVFGGVVVIGLNATHKHAFPGLEEYYDHPVALQTSVVVDSKAESAALLQPISTLEQWRNGIGKDCSNLIIVATSGGAYRSAYWTGAVLDELERLSADDKQHGKLSNCIRLVTGASGGMVGAAYYVAMKNEVAKETKSDRLPIASVIARLNRDTRCARSRRPNPEEGCTEKGKHFPTFFPYSRDSLTPVAHQLIREDIHLFSFSSKPSSMDRGRVLEDQWLTLDKTFKWLQAQEKEGRIPSLLVTPLAFWTETDDENEEIKESFAMPLLISNLDANSLAGPSGRHGLAFFDLFPRAVGDLKLKTAIRMNATFPYVSPAVALPTVPPVRVVDAGYYENYGIAAAATWLFTARDEGRKETPLKWLQKQNEKKKGLGIVIIQIRAYPFDSSALSKDRECPKGKDTEDATGTTNGKGTNTAKNGNDDNPPVFQALTSPFEAIVSVRDSGMNIRNDQQIALLNASLPGVRVQTVAFENTKDVGMSWYLVPSEVACLEQEVKSDFNSNQWTRLLELVSDENPDVRRNEEN